MNAVPLLYYHQNILRICILLLWIITSPLMAESYSASIDRTQITIDESLMLTLRMYENTTDSPDLTPLRENFNILQKNRNQQMRSINGKTSSWIDWQITLSPKKTGSLTIPSIPLGDKTSNPITILVTDTDAQSTDTPPVFIRSSVDNIEPYIQQQTILTIKFFYRVNLGNDMSLTPLTMDKALVHSLGDSQPFESIINGQRYKGIQLKFAIFPQNSGPITIPALNLHAAIISQLQNAFSVFSSVTQKPIVVHTSPITLNVKDKDTLYTGSTWLPASNISLQEKWSKSLGKIHVGDAITRTIDVKALGLLSAQLPNINPPTLDNVNIYPDKVVAKDDQNDAGVLGTQTYSFAFVPTQSGKITIPSTNYTWFNLTTNQQEMLSLPEININVLPATNLTKKTSSIPVTTNTQKNDKIDLSPIIKNTNVNKKEATSIQPNNDYFWKSTTGILFFILLIILIKNKYNHSASKQKNYNISTAKNTEKNTFKRLITHCKNENIQETKLAFIAWTQASFNNNNLSTMNQCIQQWSISDLYDLFTRIDSSIYSSNKTSPPFVALQASLFKIRKNNNHNKKDKSDLPNLYPIKKYD